MPWAPSSGFLVPRGSALGASDWIGARRCDPAWPDQVEVRAGETQAGLLDRLCSLPAAPARDEVARRIRFNHPGIDLDALRAGDVLSLAPAEARAPTRSELLKSPLVRRAVESAWADSRSADPDARHEEGGWIYMNTKSGEVFAHRALAGGRAGIDLSQPVLYVDAVIVATFHTHPNPPNERFELGPSASDEAMDRSRGVPGIVRSVAGYHAYGWDRRESLAGCGYFPGTADRPLEAACR